MTMIRKNSRAKSLRFKFKPLAFIAAAVMSVVVAIAFFSNSPLLAQTSPTKISFVPPSWVTANANDPDLRILDVRWNPLDYFKEHLPKAVNFADNLVRVPKDGLPVQLLDSNKLGDLLAKAGVTDKSKVLVYSEGNNILGSSLTSVESLAVLVRASSAAEDSCWISV